MCCCLGATMLSRFITFRSLAAAVVLSGELASSLGGEAIAQDASVVLANVEVVTEVEPGPVEPHSFLGFAIQAALEARPDHALD